MDNNSRWKYYMLLHVVIFIFGFTGVLGKQITDSQPTFDALNIVLYRMIIAFLGLFLFMKIKGQILNIGRKAFMAFIGVGGLIAIHWITFFGAIEASNVSVALACISSTALFTSILEPFLMKKKFDLSEIFLGMATIIGIYFITKSTNDDGLNYQNGIVLSVFSAFFAALFGVLNANLAKKHDPVSISTVEMISGSLFTFGFMLVAGYEILMPENISGENWIRVTTLGLVATSIAFVATVYIMRVLTPFTVALSINLEPVYAVIMAVILFPETEKMSPLFYIGAGLILITIIVNALIKFVKRRKQEASILET